MNRPRLTTFALLLLFPFAACASAPEKPRRSSRLRVATFNASLSRDTAGALIRELASGSDQARQVAAIVQRVRPDILVVQELDADPAGASADLLRTRYFAVSQVGSEAIEYPFRYVPTSNTGLPSGLDLDHDGRIGGPGDAFGFGRHPGQFGFAIFSRFPIDAASVRSFANLTWAAMPDNAMPHEPGGDEAAAKMRLSSKNHVDVPILLPDRRTLHLLVSHPTPPVFDGPEDRNGRRNHDEIRFWRDYLDPAASAWIVDDSGRAGGSIPGAAFVICGDMNSDPNDGDSFENPIRMLLDAKRIDSRFVPRSAGAIDSARRDGGKNATQVSPSDADTGDFDDEKGPGNLRVDYVLPSRDFAVVDGGVYWPASDDPDAALARVSDHHLVWLDLH